MPDLYTVSVWQCSAPDTMPDLYTLSLWQCSAPDTRPDLYTVSVWQCSAPDTMPALYTVSLWQCSAPDTRPDLYTLSLLPICPSQLLFSIRHNRGLPCSMQQMVHADLIPGCACILLIIRLVLSYGHLVRYTDNLSCTTILAYQPISSLASLGCTVYFCSIPPTHRGLPLENNPVIFLAYCITAADVWAIMAFYIASWRCIMAVKFVLPGKILLL